MTALLLTIRNAAWKSWWQTLLWVGYNALGSLMPIWGTYFLIKLHGQPFHLNEFVRHGEFALYSATFLAPALQMVVRNIRDGKYVLGTGAVLFAFVGFAISVDIYSGVATGVKYPQDIDEFFLFWISIGLFAASLGFAVLVALIENEQISPNIHKTEASEQSMLNQRFSGKRPQPAPEIRDLPAPPEDSVPATEEELAAQFKPEAEAIHPESGKVGGNA